MSSECRDTHLRASGVAWPVRRAALKGADTTGMALLAPVSILLAYSAEPPSTSLSSGTRPRMKVRKPEKSQMAQ